VSSLPLTGREFLGRGWRFPPRVDARGSLAWASAEEDVEQSVWLIVATARNEREMRPTFGCGIHDAVFAPSSPATRARLADSVRQALVDWEPRIEVVDVEVTSPTDPTVLLVEIQYRVRATNTVRNLVYPFYVQEGVAG
jgi:phage baseplate assembly protein W